MLTYICTSISELTNFCKFNTKILLHYQSIIYAVHLKEFCKWFFKTRRGFFIAFFKIFSSFATLNHGWRMGSSFLQGSTPLLSSSRIYQTIKFEQLAFYVTQKIITWFIFELVNFCLQPYQSKKFQALNLNIFEFSLANVLNFHSQNICLNFTTINFKAFVLRKFLIGWREQKNS